METPPRSPEQIFDELVANDGVIKRLTEETQSFKGKRSERDDKLREQAEVIRAEIAELAKERTAINKKIRVKKHAINTINDKMKTSVSGDTSHRLCARKRVLRKRARMMAEREARDHAKREFWKKQIVKVDPPK